jgi:hypothetical protein
MSKYKLLVKHFDSMVGEEIKFKFWIFQDDKYLYAGGRDSKIKDKMIVLHENDDYFFELQNAMPISNELAEKYLEFRFFDLNISHLEADFPEALL